MIVKLLTEHNLEFLSLKGGCRGSSESTHVKMPHCWKSHARANILLTFQVLETGIDITDEVTIIPAEFESFDEVFCDISRYSTSPLYGFLVSVSNNGLTTGQSEQHLYVAHNEKCWACQVTDGNQASCVREVTSYYFICASALYINLYNFYICYEPAIWLTFLSRVYFQ